LAIFNTNKQFLEVYDKKVHKYLKLFIDIDIIYKIKNILYKNKFDEVRIKRKKLIDFYKKKDWIIVDFSREIDN
jgi:hypothetical protein